MALTTTQVNAAFVALLGRAAEGNANAWAVNSADTKTLASTILSVDGKFAKIDGKNIASIEQAKTNEDFVEALYQTVLGRDSDADGKAVWLNALANGVSREDLMTQFVTAAKAEDPELNAFNTNNLAFLDEIYLKLLNRSVDDSGKATWLGLLNSGASKAEVVAKIIEAISANPAGDDYAIYNAKMGVANAVTAAFAGPKAGLNAEQNKALNEKLIAIMDSVSSADVKATDENIKAEISNTVGSYGKETAPLTFHTVTENMKPYELGNTESTTAQTFRGTINLKDPTKSTINSNATLNTSNFSDTLVVDVISSGETAFNYSTSKVKDFANKPGIDNLTINNGTAKITGLDNTGISGNLKITGAANVSGSVTTDLQYLEVNTGGNSNTKATIAVNAKLNEYVGKGSGKDEITVSGAAASVDKISTGAGDDKLLVSSGTVKDVNLGSGIDTLTVSGGSISGATINLGAGNDKIIIASGDLTKATIDGGAGRDTLVVGGNISGSGDFTLKNVEVLEASVSGATVSYAQIKGQALTLTKSGSGDKLTIDAAKETTIDLSKLNNNAATGETKLTDLTLSSVGSGTSTGVTITLNKDDKISETITLASGGETVTIKGIAKTDILAEKDKLDISGAGLNTTASSFVSASLSSDGKISSVATDKAIFVKASDIKMTSITDEKGLISAISDVAKSLSSGSSVIIAVNDGKDNAAIYQITGGSNTSSATDKTLKLIATVDNNIDGNDAILSGIITFA